MSELKYEFACENDAESIYGLMVEQYNKMENKSLFVCDDYEFVKEHIKRRGFTVLCKEGADIVGSFIFRYPFNDKDNLGFDVEVPENELVLVAHLESVVIKEEYRGQGIFGEMLDLGEKRLSAEGFKYFLATVSPDNPASYKNLEKKQYKNIVTKEKYNGMLRRIYLKINKNF